MDKKIDGFSKKERKKLLREEKRVFEEQKKKRNRFLKIVSLVILVFVFAGLAFLLFAKLSKNDQNLHFETVPEQSREHVSSTNHPAYNSNPPTSGPHYNRPVKAGVYDKPLMDEELVHSLEHGYVVISYNCAISTDGSKQALESANLSEDCKDLVSKAGSIYKKFPWKLIVVPRSNLDSRIALTAWGRLDKFNGFDENRMEVFIRAFRNRGPEDTPD